MIISLISASISIDTIISSVMAKSLLATSLFNKLLSNKKKGEILVEFSAYQPFHIGASILSNLLANKFSAKINSYVGFTLLVSPLKYAYINILKWKMLMLTHFEF